MINLFYSESYWGYSQTMNGPKKVITNLLESFEQENIEYAQEMNRLMNDSKYYQQCKINAGKRYNTIYNIDSIIKKFVELYQEASNDK